jgi:hypothetical protein
MYYIITSSFFPLHAPAAAITFSRQETRKRAKGGNKSCLGSDAEVEAAPAEVDIMAVDERLPSAVVVVVVEVIAAVVGLHVGVAVIVLLVIEEVEEMDKVFGIVPVIVTIGGVAVEAVGGAVVVLLPDGVADTSFDLMTSPRIGLRAVLSGRETEAAAVSGPLKPLAVALLGVEDVGIAARGDVLDLSTPVASCRRRAALCSSSRTMLSAALNTRLK